MKDKIKCNQAGYCALCESDNLEYSQPYFDGDFMYYGWKCKNCGATGREEYYVEFNRHINICDKDDNYIGKCKYNW